ncbi:hypothetical protein KI387_010146, partial [Taxus chinensis]
DEEPNPHITEEEEEEEEEELKEYSGGLNHGTKRKPTMGEKRIHEKTPLRQQEGEKVRMEMGVVEIKK